MLEVFFFHSPIGENVPYVVFKDFLSIQLPECSNESFPVGFGNIFVCCWISDLSRFLVEMIQGLPFLRPVSEKKLILNGENKLRFVCFLDSSTSEMMLELWSVAAFGYSKQFYPGRQPSPGCAVESGAFIVYLETAFPNPKHVFLLNSNRFCRRREEAREKSA